MLIVTSVAAMQRLAAKLKVQQVRVGFVPTMGYLHAGHLSLVQRARQQIGEKGQVVVSIFVNPTQFAPHEDLSKYPRDLARDKKLCRAAGVDILFIPKDAAIYPPDFSTYIVEERLSRGMEGESRPTHFRGVTTVVGKLFNLVRPDVAVFGAKDFQQGTVIQAMVRDLNFPLKIVIAPIMREADGLAMSSRNKYLSAIQREQATVLSRAIQVAKATLKNGPISSKKLEAQIRKMVSQQSEARLDYVRIFDPQTLEPVSEVKRGTHLALAVFFGKTRLIDNGRL